jgi:hypothetical protein
MVAALPLPAVRDVSALVKGALAKSAAASAAGGGTAVMATTTQKLAITAIFAAALGAGGTIAAQRLSSPASPAPDVASADTSHVDEIAKRDAEIARLRTQLADASRRRVSPRNADETRHEAPAPAVPPSTGAGAEVGKSGAQGDASPAPTVDQTAAAKQAQTWQDALRQLADPAKRDAAWAEVRNALAGADRTALLAALQTVAFTQDVKVDRTGLRDLLPPSVDGPESPIRLMGWRALINNGIESMDVDKLRGQVLDVAAEIRPQMVQRLAWAMRPTKQSIDGPNAEAVLKVLDDPGLIKDTIRVLQDVKMNDAVVAKVLDYARTNSEAAQHATHFVLRTLPDKNRDVVAFLLDRAEGGDLTGIEQFQWTIRREGVAYAGERLRKLYDARSDGYTRERIIQTIGSIGDESSREWLTAIRDDTAQPTAIQSAAKNALSLLDRARR